MSRVQEFLRARTRAAGRTPRLARDASAERDASAQGPLATRASSSDFSQVRVHTDAHAAGVADAMGARAFASGNDVYFGAGQLTPPLLAHELAHVGQQAQHGPAVDFQPKGDKAGIGTTPPEEDFIKDPENWGAEDSDVLFGQDEASVTGDNKTLSNFAATQKEAVYVHLHGYASREGATEYNLNLSAHRGVAVKHALEKLLPAGSKVFVFAHGESKHFGAAEKNRRVGISLIGPVETGFRLRGGGLHYTPGATAPVGPFLTPPTLITPTLPTGPITDPGPPGPRTNTATSPLGPAPSAPSFKIDWRAINESGTAHGVRMSERDVAGFQNSGDVLYRNLLPLFGPDLSEWWTNRVLMKAYESRVTLENPTLIDISDLDFKKRFPDAKGIPPVPLVSPETLNFIVKHTLHKDIDFHFNLP